ncbi:MAG: MFS transporter [Acidimicrobiia bacterium]|nr:MFS transporter [Acidimicrobiia bacterium]
MTTSKRLLPPRRASTVLVVGSMGLVLAVLPSFLVGGLAVQVREELALGEAALGGAVAIGFLAGALAAVLLGRLADWLGPRKAIVIGGTLSVISLFALGLFVSDWVTLVIVLCMAGVGTAVIDPGLAVLVSRALPRHEHGTAFGIKEASVPTATLLAGLAVPTIALTVGWRWAFVLGVVPVVTLAFLLPRLGMGAEVQEAVDISAERGVTGSRRRSLFLVALASALGSAAASGIGVFLTESGVAMGLSPGGAGYLLATGSIAGILTRIGTGIYADRDGGEQLGLISWMLLLGAITMALASVGSTPLLVLGAIGTFAGGWGWTGLLFLSLVRAGPRSPGTFAGFGTAGLGVGNALGPLAFGVLAQTASFRTAWLTAAVAAAAASVVMRMARRGLGSVE